jgi:hypothetical protein
MIYFCVKFQKDPLYGLNLTFFFNLGYHGNSRRTVWQLLRGWNKFIKAAVAMVTKVKKKC